jgi:hypothetical protein
MSVSVLWAPRPAFAAQRERPRGALVLLVIALCAAAPTIAYVARSDMRAVVVKEMKRAGQYDQIPGDAREIAIKAATITTTYGSPIGAAGQRAFWALVVGGLALLVFRAGAPGLTFKQTYAAAALGMAPYAVKDLILLVLFLAQDPARFDPENPLVSNLAAILGMDASKPLGALLRALDAFDLWTVWLTGVGLDVVRGAKRGGFVVPAALWVLFGLLAAAVKLAA